eukprot:COSAG05_NODE_668_length_8004_cov_3.894371_6_plen_143_part_00
MPRQRGRGRPAASAAEAAKAEGVRQAQKRLAKMRAKNPELPAVAVAAAAASAHHRQPAAPAAKTAAPEWKAGDVVDILADDGSIEHGATILGPSEEGDDDEMQVRFVDGVVDSWPTAGFRCAADACHAQRQPPTSTSSWPRH